MRARAPRMDPAHRVYPADRNMNEVLIDVYGDTLKASQAKGKKAASGGAKRRLTMGKE